MDKNEYLEAIRRNIEKSGQHVQAVFPVESEDVPFIYTIGNHEKGLPEILIIGNCNAHFASILNDLGNMMRKRGRAFENGELVNLGGQFPLKIVDIPLSVGAEYVMIVESYYDTDDYRVQQAIMCDPQGRYPGDAGCEPIYEKQTQYRKETMH